MSNKEDKEKLQELTKEDKEKLIKEDKEKLQELIKQVKQATEKIIYDGLENKKLSYFLETFAADDENIDDKELELLGWLKDDLFKTEDEDTYKKRIDNMKKKD
ncbi:MAG: hypothetical protein MK289_15215 [Trichodesmium sp. ALOHA_ZT_67]|nr:hypothetical protein [Trichodesmium sp. ALOHA_ZT_67]